MEQGGGQSIIIRQFVPEDATQKYEEWLTHFHARLGRQPGFSSVEVIHRKEERSTRYLVVATFITDADAQAWLASDELAALRETLDGIAGTTREVKVFAGREIWFEEPGPAGPAPYWKRVVLSVVCVLPTIWMTQFAIGLLGPLVPQPLHQIVTVAILSALLTWPIMPVAVRLASRWLQPARRTAER